ncbi:MAG: hypothetical protein U9Q75_08520 [Pseudomonadota bacterium]|nr:hypothetical protein [Pseudomonadota bacterium]
MQYQAFIECLEEDDCPGGLEHALQALWYDANGDWERAHEIVQQMDDVTAARIHAYLHRVEGDESNSRYWHRLAGSTFPEGMSLEEEWDSLVRSLTAFSD